MKSALGLLLLTATLACRGAAPLPTPAPDTLRMTAQGQVVGFVESHGAHVWRGIPFAASTAGPNRWRAPRPAAPWDDVRSAVTPAEPCAQLTNELDEDRDPGQVIGSEDCLTLDIYAPGRAASSARPVMVWIHGGGNVWGRSSAWDASRLAENEDLVVVAVQYRLGPLGWFSHEWLRARAEREEDTAACFATLDLIASLEWVRDNIHEFGGDPQNVTIFGESAGGHNVVSLLASPRAKGLFHRAIVQSGSFDSTPVAEAEGRSGAQKNPSNQIVERLGVRSAEELRAVSVEDLFSAYPYEGGFLQVPRVIQDGVVLPATSLRDAFSSRETFHAVPILTGTNRDEMKLFYVRDARWMKRVLGVFPVARDPDFYDALTHYLSRLWRIRSVDEPAARMRAAGHDEVFAYRFDWDDGGKFLFMDFRKTLGAAHGFELPFVFGRFVHLGDADRFLFEEATLPDRERLSRVMGGLWASFAREGVPSHADAPTWPAYGNEGALMRLDAQSDGGVEVIRGVDDLQRLAADLRDDPRIEPAERCLFLDELDAWMFTRPIRDQLREVLTCE